MEDEDPDDDSFAVPLPPEDRLWRHPSEMALAAREADTPTRRRTPLRVAAVVLLAAGAVGAVSLWRASGDAGVAAPGSTTNVDADNQNDVRTLVASWAQNVSRAVVPAVAELEIVTADGRSTTSGVVWRSDGYLLSDAYLIDLALTINVTLADGSIYPARVVGSDRITNIAVLHIDTVRVPAAPIDQGTELTLGDRVALVAGRDGPTEAAVQASNVTLTTGDRTLAGLAEFDVGLDGDAAGGAVVGHDGSLVGVLMSGPDGSVSHAIPIGIIDDVASDIVEYGHALHRWLPGVTADDAASTTVELADGAVVVQVERPPSGEAGLLLDDIITHVDGQRVHSVDELVEVLLGYEIGTEVTLGYRRNGTQREQEAVLGEWLDR